MDNHDHARHLGESCLESLAWRRTSACSVYGLPEFFKLDEKTITDKIDIANQCNTFFTNIGPSLTSNITTAGNKTYKSFLNEPSAHEFTFNEITEVDVLNIIDKLPSKASSGVDGIPQFY